MSNVETTEQLVEKEGRRRSEPVRLGELLVEFLAGIEVCGPGVAARGRVQPVGQAPLRKAG
jgi:hypothetical protein